jgi:hypothetical protein
MSDDELQADRVAFYRYRGREDDEWWRRQGRYDRREDESREWQARVAEVTRALRHFQPGGEFLELAGRTGWWTNAWLIQPEA